MTNSHKARLARVAAGHYYFGRRAGRRDGDGATTCRAGDGFDVIGRRQCRGCASLVVHASARGDSGFKCAGVCRLRREPVRGRGDAGETWSGGCSFGWCGARAARHSGRRGGRCGGRCMRELRTVRVQAHTCIVMARPEMPASSTAMRTVERCRLQAGGARLHGGDSNPGWYFQMAHSLLNMRPL